MIHYLDSYPGREILVDGKKMLYFGGTSYLGLQTDLEFQEIFIDYIKKYGTSYGASRKSNVRLSIFKTVEDYLAKLVGSESCITLSSGYLAAQFLVQNFATAEHKFFYAPHTHSALHLTNSKPYATYTALNIALREHLRTKKKVSPVLLLDSIDFSGCNYPDFRGLEDLPLDQLILIVDDSHGIGIVGPKGGGVFKKLEALKSKEILICCSLGKAFGVQAGAVFGKKERIQSLTETDFFGGASPPSPAGMATLLGTQALFQRKRETLKDNIRCFLTQLQNQENFLFMQDYPVFSFVDQMLTTYLEQHDIVTTNFSYPSDRDTTKSRIVLGAQHNQDDILQLTSLLDTYDF